MNLILNIISEIFLISPPRIGYEILNTLYMYLSMHEIYIREIDIQDTYKIPLHILTGKCTILCGTNLLKGNVNFKFK